MDFREANAELTRLKKLIDETWYETNDKQQRAFLVIVLSLAIKGFDSWEGRDIKPRGSPDCHMVGGTCLTIKDLQYKTATAIEQELKHFDDQNSMVVRDRSLLSSSNRSLF